MIRLEHHPSVSHVVQISFQTVHTMKILDAFGWDRMWPNTPRPTIFDDKDGSPCADDSFVPEKS